MGQSGDTRFPIETGWYWQNTTFDKAIHKVQAEIQQFLQAPEFVLDTWTHKLKYKSTKPE